MHAHGVGRRSSLKAHAEEHNLLFGILDREFDSIERRVDHAYVAAAALDLEEIALGPRNAQHVAEGAEDDAGLGGDGERLVNEFERSDANRAAGTVNHLDTCLRPVRQHLVDAVFDNRVRLPAADFHDLPGPRGGLRNLPRQRSRDLAVAKLGEVPHSLIPSPRPMGAPHLDFEIRDTTKLNSPFSTHHEQRVPHPKRVLCV